MFFHDVITGEETHPRDAIHRALIDFYRAFNARDIEAMQACWARGGESVMANPVGGQMHGWEAIEAVYRKIFYGKALVYVEYYDYTLYETDTMFCVTGKERGSFASDDATLALDIRTTRIYKLFESGWKQLHHHGSITDASLLSDYQKAVGFSAAAT